MRSGPCQHCGYAVIEWYQRGARCRKCHTEQPKCPTERSPKVPLNKGRCHTEHRDCPTERLTEHRAFLVARVLAAALSARNQDWHE
jgi:hypothetical protein